MTCEQEQAQAAFEAACLILAEDNRRSCRAKRQEQVENDQTLEPYMPEKKAPCKL